MRNRKRALQVRVDVREPSVVELTVRKRVQVDRGDLGPEPPPTFPISRGDVPAGSPPTLIVS